MHATIRNDPVNARCTGQIDVTTPHPRRQMPASGMPCYMNRPIDTRSGKIDSGRNLAGDVGDPNLGAQDITGHGNRPTPRNRPCCQMRPQVLVARNPIASVDENHQPFGRAFRMENIHNLARVLAVGYVQLCPIGSGHLGAKSRAVSFPCGNDIVHAININPVRISIVPIGYHHTLLNGISIVLVSRYQMPRPMQ